MRESLEWLETPGFTGKSWRWEGPARWRGELVRPSVWHDSSAPTRKGSAPDPALLRRMTQRLTKALAEWPKLRGELVTRFERHRARHYPKGKKVTAESLGPVTVELPNGVRGPAVAFSFRECRAFGPHLWPVAYRNGRALDLQLEVARDARDKVLVVYDPEKHVVGDAKPAPRPKFGTLPGRGAIKPLRVPWLQPFTQEDGVWRAKVNFMGKPLLVTSVQEVEPKQDDVRRALGVFILAKQLAAQRAAHLYSDAGWGSKPIAIGKVGAKFKLKGLSMLDGEWTFIFGDGGLFGGHEVHAYAEGRNVEVDLVG